MKKNYIIILLLTFSILSFSQTIENIAGNGTSGFSGDNGNSNNAQLSLPRDIDIDSNGNLYITDRDNHRIRKVDNNGIITTIAGTNAFGYSGDGGLSTNAQIKKPQGLKIDSNDNIYFIDNNNHCIRKIDTNGIISTIAGNGNSGFSGDGGPAVNALLSFPQDLTIDNTGNIYIADSGNKRIRKIDTSGIISTIAGNGNNNTSGDNGQAISSEIKYPTNIHIDSNSNIYLSDWTDHIVRKIDNNGIITTIAGNGTSGFSGDNGNANSAQLNYPSGLTTLNGTLYIADRDNYRIRKVDNSGIITTYAGGTNGCENNGGLSNYKTKGIISIISNNNNLYVVNQSFCSSIAKIVDSSLSINENYVLDFSVFPNPAFNFVNIKSISIIDKIQVFDILGKVILTENINNSTFTLNLENFKTGIYILKVKSENKIESFKLIKK